MIAIIQRMQGQTCGKGSAHRPPNLCANASQGGPAEHREEGRPNPRLLTGALISSAAGRSGVSSTNKKYFAIRFAPSAHHDKRSPFSRERDEPAYPDRKSTRLNSSHRCISYAV